MEEVLEYQQYKTNLVVAIREAIMSMAVLCAEINMDTWGLLYRVVVKILG